MIPQYTAASIASQNKQLATPASVDSIVSSNGQEDHVSMGVTAGLKLCDILDNVEQILAIELLTAAQGIDFRKRTLGPDAPLGRGTGAAYRLIRQEVPFVEYDQLLDGFMAHVRQLVANGNITAAVRASVGE